MDTNEKKSILLKKISCEGQNVCKIEMKDTITFLFIFIVKVFVPSSTSLLSFVLPWPEVTI